MSVEGERFLLQIDAMLNRMQDSEVEGETEYSFQNLLEGDINRFKVMGIISVLVKGNKKIEPKLRELLNSPDLRNKIMNIKDSGRTIEDDIESTFIQIIQGKKPVVKKHPKQPVEKKKPLRALRGTFYSLVNLQKLLNSKLPDVIQSNMGKGTATKILNYRTGRFANIVVVRKLATTRDNEIAVFYTYMKYPYQTFEPGFKQGEPNTRNPKLLISKSIRQIAASIVSNRMKAILV